MKVVVHSRLGLFSKLAQPAGAAADPPQRQSRRILARIQDEAARRSRSAAVSLAPLRGATVREPTLKQLCGIRGTFFSHDELPFAKAVPV
jgi:hypothetical protein